MGLIADTLDGARAIIFDCDDTPVDSTPLYAKAWAADLPTSGHAMTEASHRERSSLSEHVFMDSLPLANLTQPTAIDTPEPAEPAPREPETAAPKTASAPPAPHVSSMSPDTREGRVLTRLNA